MAIADNYKRNIPPQDTTNGPIKYTVPPNAELEDVIKKGVQEKNNPPSPQRYAWRRSSAGSSTWVVVEGDNTIAICYRENHADLICMLLNANEP